MLWAPFRSCCSSPSSTAASFSYDLLSQNRWCQTLTRRANCLQLIASIAQVCKACKKTASAFCTLQLLLSCRTWPTGPHAANNGFTYRLMTAASSFHHINQSEAGCAGWKGSQSIKHLRFNPTFCSSSQLLEGPCDVPQSFSSPKQHRRPAFPNPGPPAAARPSGMLLPAF